MKNLLLYLIFIVFYYNNFSQTEAINYSLPLEWREMAALCINNIHESPDSLASGYELFWNYYAVDKDEIFNHISKAKKLGLNMVRITLNFLPLNYDSLHGNSYSHGWPTRPGGSLTSMSSYLSDINELLNFCKINEMKVNLVCFGTGYENDARRRNPSNTGYENIYSPGPDPTRETMNLFFKDAKNWIDAIFNGITTDNLNNIEVLEIANEIAPESEIDELSYPRTISDCFILEMTSYLSYLCHQNTSSRVFGKNLMVSLWGNGSYYFLDNFKSMMQKARWGGYSRASVPQINYSSHSLNSVKFNVFSYHTYQHHNYVFTIKDFMQKYGTGIQPYDYDIHFGETGLDIGNKNYKTVNEADQAKYWLTVFEGLRTVKSEYGEKILGVGIWSTMDFVISSENDTHSGITSSSETNVKRRSAANIVENYCEGLIDNPDFKIGPDPTPADLHWNYSPWCNGWTDWPGGGAYSGRFEYRSAIGNDKGYLVIKGGTPLANIGWSGAPGRRIRVHPGSVIKLSVNARLNSGSGTYQVFPQFSYTNIYGTYLSGSEMKVCTLNTGWTKITIIDTIPSGVFYAIPYLHAWNIPELKEVHFDNIRIEMQAKPHISFQFKNDLNYYEPGPHNLGWNIDDPYTITISDDDYIEMSQSFYLKSTHQYQDVAFPYNWHYSAIRVRPDKYYFISGFFRSIGAYLEFLYLNSGADESPSTASSNSVVSNIIGGNWNMFYTNTLYNSSSNWLHTQLLSAQYLEAKELTVFEYNPNFSIQKENYPKELINKYNLQLFNYPNPFNPSTNIKYSIPNPEHVSVVVYNSLGQSIIELVNDQQDRGEYSVNFDGSNLASGIYFCTLRTGDFFLVRKMLLIK